LTENIKEQGCTVPKAELIGKQATIYNFLNLVKVGLYEDI